MTRTTWINRLSAAAAVGLCGVALVSAAAVAGDVFAVRRAEARSTSEPPMLEASPPERALKPLLRRGQATAETAVGEYLNGRLGQMGLAVTSARVTTLRPLGDGLFLAEVEVEARGDAAAAAAAANWVAVNREAVRMSSLSLTSDAAGGRCRLVLLMVVA